MWKEISKFFRIRVKRNSVWFSEFVLIFMLFFLIFIPILEIRRIFSNSKIIAENELHEIELRQQLSLAEGLHLHLVNQFKIYKTLKEFTGGKLSDEILYKLTGVVVRNSELFGYDPFLVLSVIHVESTFNYSARGRYKSGKLSGAFGLMQLKEETAREVASQLGIRFKGKEDLFIPEKNIALGVAYLTRMISMFKSVKLGILAYNQGPGVIYNSLKKDNSLSVKYYKKVLKNYFKLKKISDNYLD